MELWEGPSGPDPEAGRLANRQKTLSDRIRGPGEERFLGLWERPSGRDMPAESLTNRRRTVRIPAPPGPSASR